VTARRARSHPIKHRRGRSRALLPMVGTTAGAFANLLVRLGLRGFGRVRNIRRPQGVFHLRSPRVPQPPNEDSRGPARRPPFVECHTRAGPRLGRSCVRAERPGLGLGAIKGRLLYAFCRDNDDIAFDWIGGLRLGPRHALRGAGRRAQADQARAYLAQPAAGPGMRGLRRNNGNTVCWTTCGQPGSIVMGRDPDPFIRQQILRDASGFFGGQP